MALTVDEALAALASAYDADPATPWCLQALLTITDTAGTLSGIGTQGTSPGRLFGAPHPFAGAPLGNLKDPIWNSGDKFVVHRGEEWTGFDEFLIGLDIEAVVAIVGPLTLRPPAFAWSFMQRHGFLSSTHYRGVLSVEQSARFTVALTENPLNPKLTGTITRSPSGAFVPPATIEVVILDSVIDSSLL